MLGMDRRATEPGLWWVERASLLCNMPAPSGGTVRAEPAWSRREVGGVVVSVCAGVTHPSLKERACKGKRQCEPGQSGCD